LKKNVAKLVALFFIGLILTQNANAAGCTAMQLWGQFSFELKGFDGDLNPVHVVGIVQFDGVDEGKIVSAQEGILGSRQKFTGSGKFIARNNCTAIWKFRRSDTDQLVIVDIVGIGSMSDLRLMATITRAGVTLSGSARQTGIIAF
jgi:hypothetical protein